MFATCVCNMNGKKKKTMKNKKRKNFFFHHRQTTNERWHCRTVCPAHVGPNGPTAGAAPTTGLLRQPAGVVPVWRRPVRASHSSMLTTPFLQEQRSLPVETTKERGRGDGGGVADRPGAVEPAVRRGAQGDPRIPVVGSPCTADHVARGNVAGSHRRAARKGIHGHLSVGHGRSPWAGRAEHCCLYVDAPTGTTTDAYDADTHSLGWTLDTGSNILRPKAPVVAKDQSVQLAHLNSLADFAMHLEQRL